MGDSTEVSRLMRAVTGQIDWWWDTIFRRRIEGLTDDEMLWEPAPDCWTLHRVEDGLVSVDFRWPPPAPTPLTTIAWRMHHIGIGCLANRTTSYFGPEVAPSERAWADVLVWKVDGPFNFERVPFPLDADAAIAFLDGWWAAWRMGLRSLDDDGLWRALGPAEFDFANMQLGVEDPFIGLVMHVHRELMHHGAEICLLRDLYRLRTTM